MLGCASMGDQYKEANIKIVTHPMEVEGMQFITGDTQQVGRGWSLYEIGIQAANSYAKDGYRDVTVLVELLQQGQTGMSVVRASVWR